MNQPRIIVQVAPDGATQVRAEGFAGTDCLAATEQLEQSLGLAAPRQLTAEFFQTKQSVGNSAIRSAE